MMIAINIPPPNKRFQPPCRFGERHETGHALIQSCGGEDIQFRRSCQTAIVAFLLVAWLLGSAAAAFSADDAAFEAAEAVFRSDQPRAAVAALEPVVRADPNNTQAVIYLGIAYEQLGLHAEAVRVLTTAAAIPAGQTPQVWLNLGNNLAKVGDGEAAVEAFSRALALDPTFVPAYVNRANQQVSADMLAEAMADYETVLRIEPTYPAAPAIRRMQAALAAEIQRREHVAAELVRQRQAEAEERARVEAERERVAAEQARAAEAERLAAEQRQREAEERRRALLDSVMDSLNTSATAEGANLSGGAEELQDIEETVDRE